MPKKRRSPIVAGGYVEGGRIQWDHARLATAPLKAWEGERVTVTIAQEEQIRSQRAHNYLFGVVYAILEKESGYSKDELHEVFKLRHNAQTLVDPVSGEEVRVGMSTKKLPVAAMSEFMEKVMWDGSTVYGVTFPEPRKHEEWREETHA